MWVLVFGKYFSFLFFFFISIVVFTNSKKNCFSFIDLFPVLVKLIDLREQSPGLIKLVTSRRAPKSRLKGSLLDGLPALQKSCHTHGRVYHRKGHRSESTKKECPEQAGEFKHKVTIVASLGLGVLL